MKYIRIDIPENEEGLPKHCFAALRQFHANGMPPEVMFPSILAIYPNHDTAVLCLFEIWSLTQKKLNKIPNEIPSDIMLSILNEAEENAIKTYEILSPDEIKQYVESRVEDRRLN